VKRDRFSPTAAFFNVRIEFLRRADVDDGFQKVPGPAVCLGWVWAMRRDISDGERFKAGEMATELTARFVVRRTDLTLGITPKDTILHGRELSIVGIKTISEGTLIEITTAERSDK
jgi:SPP1 family predicted phage head-tail adaptor